MNGTLSGFGREIYTNGSYYIGEFKDWDRHGKGKYYRNAISHSVEEGIWDQDELETPCSIDLNSIV